MSSAQSASEMEAETVTPLRAQKGCRVGALGDIVIVVFDEQATLEHLTLIESVQAELLKTHSKMVGLTIITADRLQSPSAEFRAESAKLHARFESHIVCSALVIESRG